MISVGHQGCRGKDDPDRNIASGQLNEPMELVDGHAYHFDLSGANVVAQRVRDPYIFTQGGKQGNVRRFGDRVMGGTLPELAVFRVRFTTTIRGFPRRIHGADGPACSPTT